MKGATRGVARRYARAMLEVAQAEGHARPLRDELAAAASAFSASPELQRALLHPALKADKKRRILAAVFAQASPLLKRALDLVTARGRLALLPAIAEEYARALLESEGRVPAELLSATPLEAAEAERVRAALEQVLGRGVELEARVDPALLGGVVVRAGGRDYDGSVRGRLLALKKRLTAA